MRSFLLMVQFMTRYPVPREVDYSVDRFVEGVKWMPLVGLLVGLPGAIIVAGCTSFLGTEVAVLFALALMIGVTGGLHLDGVADTADGLFSYRPKERMLEIMRDATLGTNGVLAVFLTLLSKFVLLKNLPLSCVVVAMLSAPVLGRMTTAWHTAFSGYARQTSGMGEFVGRVTGFMALQATMVSFLLSLVLFLCAGVSFVAGAVFIVLLHFIIIAWAIFFARYVQKRIGGITGDTIGATLEVSEIMTFFYFLLAWKYLL